MTKRRALRKLKATVEFFHFQADPRTKAVYLVTPRNSCRNLAELLACDLHDRFGRKALCAVDEIATVEVTLRVLKTR